MNLEERNTVERAIAKLKAISPEPYLTPDRKQGWETANVAMLSEIDNVANYLQLLLDGYYPEPIAFSQPDSVD